MSSEKFYNLSNEIEEESHQKMKSLVVAGALILVVVTLLVLGFSLIFGQKKKVETVEEEEAIVVQEKEKDPDIVQLEKDLGLVDEKLKTITSGDSELVFPSVDLKVFIKD